MLSHGLDATLRGTLSDLGIAGHQGPFYIGVSIDKRSHLMLASSRLWMAVMATVTVLATPAGAQAATVWSDCVPVLTGTFANRTHVKCASAVSGGIEWFAVDSTKVDYANRFMSMVNTALVSGKTLTINYDPADKSGAAFGCGANDCRKALGINMR